MSVQRTGTLVLLCGGLGAAVFLAACSGELPPKVESPALTALGLDGPPFDSGIMSPFGVGASQRFVIDGPPTSETDVILSFIVSGDFGDSGEYFSIWLNGKDLGSLLGSDGFDCAAPGQELTVRVPAQMFNEALQKSGRIEVELVPSDEVSASDCARGSVRMLADYCAGVGACPRATVVEGPPRVVSAISQSNTSVRVAFNEPVSAGAEDPSNYAIVQTNVNSEVGALRVISATLSSDMSTVTLETSSQSELTYTLIVTAIQDLAGNILSAPSLLVDPTRTEFAGTPAINNGPDTDGDGLSDAVEQRGWIVNITRTGGDVETIEVTSDSTVADTDGDGLDDLTEFQNRSNPRASDTDGDTLSDDDEYNSIFSAINDQDSDDDTIDDALEIGFFKTSPILADTDGDNLNDDRELFELFRDPRSADLPRPRITISQIRLQLDERYTYVNESGETVSVESSSSSSLASSSSTSFGRSDTHEWGTDGEGFLKAGGKVGYDKGVTTEFAVEGGYKWGSHDDNTVQVTSESAAETQAAFEQSLSRGRELSQTSTVTREVVGARIDVDVTIESAGDIAFTISNIEVTVMQPNPLVLGDVQPVASLLAASELTTGNPAVFNLGPLVPQHGPIIFSNTEVFPNLVEALMRSPRGLLFQVSNFDLTDELGRNFAFASQEARDRCAGIVINRGDDVPERVLVALNGQVDTNEFIDGGNVGGFDAFGRAVGVPMDYVLQDILKLPKNQRDPNGILAGLDFRADTVAAGDDVQFVPRGTTGLLPHTVVIGAGQNGVLDSAPSGDDQPDVITGYETSPSCGATVADRIIEPLIGGNGIVNTAATDDDVQVVPVGAAAGPGQVIILPGPDGVTDTLPLGDDHAQFPGQIAKPNTIAEIGGGDGIVDTAAVGDDVQLIPVGTSGVANLVAMIGPGPNGTIDTQPQGDEVYLSPDCGGGAANGPETLVRFENRRSGEFQRTWALQLDRNIPAGGDFGKLLLYPGDDVSISFIQDVDHDGILAQAEFVYGSSDTTRDTDGDGLDDFSEVAVGWTVGVGGQPLAKVFPSPSTPDSDGDGLTDRQEQDLSRYITNPATFQAIFGAPPNPASPRSSNPRLADTDGDGISDKIELDGYAIGLSIRAGADDIAQSEALGDDVQKVFLGSPAFDPGGPSGGVVILPGPNRVIDSRALGDDVLDLGRTVRTNPLNRDHDGDTRPDGQERDLGGDPTNANDSDDFRDTDRDGLSDADEAILGWSVTTRNAQGVATTRFVTSNKFVPDTDFDGLPDLLERLLGSDATREDTDADGVTDYHEFGQFADFVDLGLRFPGFVLDGRNSSAFGTNLNRVDTDGDTLTDQFELEVGWRVFAFGDAAPRAVRPDARFPDSDLDGLRDDSEFVLKTDPLDADTDGDSRLDGIDIARCRSTNALCLPVPGACTDCEGSNPLRPDIAVTITYEAVQISARSGSEAADGTPNQLDWNFSYGFRVPGSALYDDLTETFSDEDATVGDAACVARTFCAACQASNTINPAYELTSPQSTTIAMIPGDLLILEGGIGDIATCTSGLVYSGFAGYRQTFTFSQLQGAGSSFRADDVVTLQGSPLQFTSTVYVLIEVR
ncbi:MAG: hypothetical protein SF069_15395 [Phycisphaerae bacterium]|nr:hypothetical protein [Phycisphaerae bacterium]